MRCVRRAAGLAVAGALAQFACGGSSSSSSVTSPSFGSAGPNVETIVVDGGPNHDYANGAFVSVTVCVPGGSQCQTIDGVLVDTGSSGLRILSSELSVKLPGITDASGAPIVECAQFQDSNDWGPMERADVRIGGESAASIPVQVLGDPRFPSVPKACSSGGLPNQTTLATLGARGVLGIGLYQQDCGPACTVASSSNPGVYYVCPASGCHVSGVSLGDQATNPVALFSGDNNGVALQLPAVTSGGAPTLTGQLVFGIGTRDNNSLGGATVYRVDGLGNITTVFHNKTYPASFIDSGSNGFYFLDAAAAGLPLCPDTKDFYCPATPAALSATIRGTTGTSGNVDFTIDNADRLFNTANFALTTLGGPNAGGFDWGLPFFMGRTVFTALELQNTPAGVGPYFAY
jgi:hypothetical protein